MNDAYTNLHPNTVAFPELGLKFDLDPTAFTIFGLDIQWYGLLITCGLLLAIFYCFSRMKYYGINSDRAVDAVIVGIVGGVVGARLYYVLLEWDRYSADPMSIFNLRNGGLAIYGGLIGAILFGGITAKIRKVRLLPLLDIACQGFLIGQCIGRWGNFFNQEAFGCNTDTLFGMTGGKIQNWISSYYINTNCYDSTGVEMNPNLPVHPCFLYESVWCLLGFIFLAIVAKKWRRFDGQILLMYTAWYGLGRFFIEGLRTDSLVIGSIRVSQVLAICCFIVSVILLIIMGMRVKRMGSDYQLYVNTEESRQLLSEAAAKPKKADPEQTASTLDIIPEDNESSIIATADAEDLIHETTASDDPPSASIEEDVPHPSNGDIPENSTDSNPKEDI